MNPLTLCLLTAPALFATDALPPAALGAQPVAAALSVADDPAQRLEAWPELDKDVEREVEAEISKLRAARTEEMESSALAALGAIGAGAAPGLLKALGKEKQAQARERIVTALESITAAQHSRLLAAEFEARSTYQRSFALARCASFGDKGLLEPAGEALAAARKAADDERLKPEELTLARLELRAAALCECGSGGIEGYDVLLELAGKSWKKEAATLRETLAGLRAMQASSAACARVIELASDPADAAALRLLGFIGEPSCTAFVGRALDSQDNSVRVAAINALRAIVDSDPPLEHISVFDAIERANAWKARL